MTLDDILEGIAYGLSHSPKNEKERQHRKRVVNECYTELLGSDQWQFLEKVMRNFKVWPTMQLKGASVQINGYQMNLLVNPLQIPPEYIGGRVEIIDAANEQVLPYDTYITYIPDGTGWWTTYFGPDVTHDPVTIRIYPRTKLPDDLAEVKGIVNRQSGRGVITHMPLAEEQHYNLYTDEAPNWQDNAQRHGDSPAAWTMDAPEKQDLGPQRAPVVATEADTETTIQPNTLYRFMYIYMKEGRESAPSDIVEFTSPGDTTNLKWKMDFLEGWSNSADWRGWVRRAYMAVGKSGPFFFVAEDQFPVDSLNSVEFGGAVPVDPDRWLPTGPARYIRFWPPLPVYQITPDPPYATVAAPMHLVVEVRYQLWPTEFMGDDDQPQLPIEHHRILVHLGCARLAAKRDDAGLVKFHDKMAADMMRTMRKRYLTEIATSYRMRQWTSSLNGAGFHRPVVRKLN